MRFKTSFFCVLLLSMIMAVGCADRTVRMFTANLPVYQDKATWRAQPISMGAPQGLQHPGRIYVYGHLLIVNEFMRGVHIFDNSNPASPVNLGFLPVIANADIAVRENVLYLDSYTDLLAFDLSDPTRPTLISRLEDVLEFQDYADFSYLPGYNTDYPFADIDPSKGIITGWTVGECTTDNYNNHATVIFGGGMDNFAGGTGNGKTSNLNNVGIAASTARFALHDHYLYSLSQWQLKVFDIQSGIVRRGTVDLSMNGMPETLFPAEGNLFIGTTTGMLIYSLANPSSPTYLSSFDHGNSCDPVVVQGDKAFVTLASGRQCPGFQDVLDVIDISNLHQPSLLYTYQLTNPRGLGVDEDLLFICDGADGLKVFDKKNLDRIDQNLIDQFGSIVANDVIPVGDVLIMTSSAGISQYDYTDVSNIHQVSLIPVQR